MSAELPVGNLTSPNSYMNNTLMKLEPDLEAFMDDRLQQQQQQHTMPGAIKMDHTMQDLNDVSQHYMAPVGIDGSGTLKPDPAMWQDSIGLSGAAAPGFLVSSPGPSLDAVGGSSGFHSGVQLPADSAASHGSTDLGRMTPGLPQFHEQQSFGGGSAAEAAAAGLSQLQDMHPGALPAVGAGSPPREGPQPSSGLVPQGFGTMGNNSAGGNADSVSNGHAAGRAASSAAQQHSRASSSSQHYAGGRSSASVAAAAAAGEGQQVFRSQYRGVSYDKKKRKWRVQIKVAALGKSGVSVGYFDTEDAAARAYDRAAIGLLGRQNCRAILNFAIEDYDNDSVPELVGKSREEVKATLKSERAKMPRRRLTNRRRTSRYLGVGSSNRKNQWQARILYHGKVTHLGYYRTEEEAARVYDKVSISLHGAGAQTNFPIDQYKHEVGNLQQKLSGLTREELQRALGVKPMDKSSKYRGVSKKKGRWEAKVMLNRKWAYREMFDTEMEAARAYDTAVWRLKPCEARNYANFKDTCPADVAEALKAAEKDSQLEMHPTGLPLTAKPLIDAGLLFDDEGQSIRAPNGMTRSVSIGDLLSLGDSATHSASEPSAGNGSGSGGLQQAHSSGGVSGGASGAVAGDPEGPDTVAAAFTSVGGVGGRMVKSASYSALSGLEAGAVTSNMSNLVASPPDPAAAAAAPVPVSSLAGLGRGLHGELNSHSMVYPGMSQQQFQQQLSSSFDGRSFYTANQHQFGQQDSSGFGNSGGGMPRVQSVPQLRSLDAGSPTLPPVTSSSSGGALAGLQQFGSNPLQHMQQQYSFQQQHQQPELGVQNSNMQYGGTKLEGTFWNTELSYQDQHHQQQQQQQHGLRMSRSCGNLAFMTGSSSPTTLAPPVAAASAAPAAVMLSSPGIGSPRTSLPGTFSGIPSEYAGESRPLMVRVGSEQHLINPNPTTNFKGLSRIASESHLSSMVPVSPSAHQFIGPERGLFDRPCYGTRMQQQQQPQALQQYGSLDYMQQAYQLQQQQYSPGLPMFRPGPANTGNFAMQQQQAALPQGLSGSFYPSAVPQQDRSVSFAPLPPSTGGMASFSHTSSGSSAAQQSSLRRNTSSAMHRAQSCATLESIDETAAVRTFGHGHSYSGGAVDMDGILHGGGLNGTGLSPTMQGQLGGQSYGMPAQQQPSQQQQQQQLGSMIGSAGMYGTTGPGPAVPQQAGHFESQTSQRAYMGHSAAAGAGFGQSSASTVDGMPSSTAPMTGAAAAEAFGAAAAAAGGVGAYSMGNTAPGAAGDTKSWQQPSTTWGDGADSPIGNVQIGGEDLDVTMAFLTDGSPRHVSDADNLDISLADFGPGLRLPSPARSQSTSALLYDNVMPGGLDTADLGMRMDE